MFRQFAFPSVRMSSFTLSICEVRSAGRATLLKWSSSGAAFNNCWNVAEIELRSGTFFRKNGTGSTSSIFTHLPSFVMTVPR